MNYAKKGRRNFKLHKCASIAQLETISEFRRRRKISTCRISKNEAKIEAMGYVKDIVEEAKINANREA